MIRFLPMHFNDREKRVMALLFDGLDELQVAEQMGITQEQVRTAMRHVSDKLWMYLKWRRTGPLDSR